MPRVFVVHLRPGQEGPGLVVGLVDADKASEMRDRYENQLWPHIAAARMLGAQAPAPPGGHEIVVLQEVTLKAVKA
jgi:hypothetical protein